MTDTEKCLIEWAIFLNKSTIVDFMIILAIRILVKKILVSGAFVTQYTLPEANNFGRTRISI